MPPLPILIDTDPGVDDALALLMAARSPELELVAVTTVAGNVGLQPTTRNALLLLELAGRPEVPVHSGEAPPGADRVPFEGGPPTDAASAAPSGDDQGSFLDLRPVRAALPPPTAADVHGVDGLGGMTLLRDASGRLRYPAPDRAPDRLSAAQAISRGARERPGELTLVAIGPLTNVARAAERDPEGMRLLREIVGMGGAFRCPGNVTAVAEFNIYVDPEAAQAVLDLGVPFRFVPLDVTEKVLIRPDDLERQSTRATPLLRDLLAHTFQFYEERVGSPGCHLHDPLAIAALIRPDLFRFRPAFVAVEAAGELTRGMTVADLRERRLPPSPNCAFAEQVDVEGARELVLGRLLAD